MQLSRTSTFALLLLAAAFSAADDIKYYDSPGSYPDVTNALANEYGATAPTETIQQAYQVQGSGPVDLTFNFRVDNGSYQFEFGFYKITSSLNAIDLSTDAGKMQYAQEALSASSTTLVFRDATQNPGASATLTANGGDILGFFLIPNNTLADYLASSGDFALDGSKNPFPLFSVSGVNPGGLDQLMSFNGTSLSNGADTNLFAWEDLARATGSDNSFSDLIFTVNGVKSISPTAPAPDSLAVYAVSGLAAFRRRRRSKA